MKPKSKSLTDLSINKIFDMVQNIQSVSVEAIDYFQPFRQIWRLYKSDRHCEFCENMKATSNEPVSPVPTAFQTQREAQEFIKWSLTELFDCTHLHINEIFNDSGFNQRFDFVLKSEQDFPYLKKLSLGSSAVDKSVEAFKYETHEEELKEALEVIVKKMPNLEVLFLDSFCDDDILSEIVAPIKTLKELRLDHMPLSCPDDERFTDDGLLDFITRTKSSITTLYLKNSICCGLTCKSLLRLKRLKELKKLSLFSKHLQYFKHSIDHFEESYENYSVESIEYNAIYGAKSEDLKILSRMFPNAVIKQKGIDCLPILGFD